MQSSKFALTLNWALVGAVVGIGVAGLNQAIGQGGRSEMRRATTDGWIVSARYDQANWPEMKFAVTVENGQKTPRSFECTAQLTRNEFKGNMTSRVSRPSDTVRTELETQNLSANIAAGASRTFTLVFRAKPDLAADKKSGRISYAMTILRDGKPIAGATAFAAAAPIIR